MFYFLSDLGFSPMNVMFLILLFCILCGVAYIRCHKSKDPIDKDPIDYDQFYERCINDGFIDIHAIFHTLIEFTLRNYIPGAKSKLMFIKNEWCDVIVDNNNDEFNRGITKKCLNYLIILLKENKNKNKINAVVRIQSIYRGKKVRDHMKDKAKIIKLD